MICSITSAEDCRAFLEDLCPPKELGRMSERLRAAVLLRAGKTYDEIIAETEISPATLSRVSKCVKNGSGYYRVPDRDTNEKKSISQVFCKEKAERSLFRLFAC